jgi:hypothetical protein
MKNLPKHDGPLFGGRGRYARSRANLAKSIQEPLKLNTSRHKKINNGRMQYPG